MIALNIEDSHKHLLGIAKEFDRICTKYNIPYYMIGGTLLGAIRHKGFIPWDDDMDFGVPINYYEKLVSVLGSELKYPYRLCSYKNSKGCLTPYAKIEDVTTCIVDKCQNLPINEQIGLNIDLFPLVYCERNIICRVFTLVYHLFSKIYAESMTSSKKKRLVKRILRKIFPVSKRKFQDLIWKLTFNIKGQSYLANLYGLAGNREFIPVSFYGEGVRCNFEDTQFLAPLKFHEYLTQIFHDYMKLPPIEKRKVHSEHVYLKDKN